MKKLEIVKDDWFNKLDGRWQKLPLKKQHSYTLLFFLAYLLLTIGVILKVWYDTGKRYSGVAIEHIENPVIKKNGSGIISQDSLSNILKTKFYERK